MFTLTEKLVALALVPVALPLFWYMAKFGMNDSKRIVDEALEEVIKEFKPK